MHLLLLLLQEGCRRCQAGAVQRYTTATANQCDLTAHDAACDAARDAARDAAHAHDATRHDDAATCAHHCQGLIYSTKFIYLVIRY